MERKDCEADFHRWGSLLVWFNVNTSTLLHWFRGKSVWSVVFLFLLCMYKIFFNVVHFESLYWICYNTVSVLGLFLFFFFFFFFFWPQDQKKFPCGILAPCPGIKLTLAALEGEVLTTGWPGKSQVLLTFTIKPSYKLRKLLDT